MKLRGMRELRRAGRWLASRFTRGALVLLYHRVAEVDRAADPFSLCVTPGRFADQLEVLRREATPLSLAELTTALAHGELPERAVALTFDDGYVDNLEAAKPLLERFAVPATVFVVSGAVGGRFWWEELARSLRAPGGLPRSLELPIDGRPFRWRRRSGPDEARRLLAALHPRLLPLPEEQRQALLAELAGWSGAPPEHGSARPMDAAEVRRLAAGDLVEIGAHSVSHPRLATLSSDRQRREIAGSRDALEKLTGGAVSSFSYPFGEAHDASRDTVEVTRAAGFERACTNVVGTATPGADPLWLPRYWVEDWSGEQLWHRLRRWL